MEKSFDKNHKLIRNVLAFRPKPKSFLYKLIGKAKYNKTKV